MHTDFEQKGRHSTAFLVVAAAFVSTLIVSNIISFKLISLWGWIVPAAVIVFPISYILGDVFTEVYGYARARIIIWLGFACNLAVVGFIAASVALPPASFWPHQEAYAQVLSYMPRLLVASFVAYLVGEFTNAFILAKLKVVTQGRHLWSRTIGSTLVGQALDSAVFMSIAFIGVLPPEALITAAVTQWAIKSGYEVLATPLTYLVVGYLKRYEGMDVYDRNVSFNPFRLKSSQP